MSVPVMMILSWMVAFPLLFYPPLEKAIMHFLTQSIIAFSKEEGDAAK
jgi:hypothetical protein